MQVKVRFFALLFLIKTIFLKKGSPYAVKLEGQSTFMFSIHVFDLFYCLHNQTHFLLQYIYKHLK